MADFYGSTFSGVLDGTKPPVKADGGRSRAKIRRSLEIINMATINAGVGLPAGSRICIGKLPIGASFDSIIVDTDTSLGSTTLAFGTTASAAKYGAAATFTATDTPTGKAPAAAKAQAPLTAEELVYATTAAATMPASGLLILELRWSEAA